MNQYRNVADRQQEEVNAFPMHYAFTPEDLAEGMADFGLEVWETGKIQMLPFGGFMRKEDYPKWKEMQKRHAEEVRSAVKADTTGDGFIFDMFYEELNNHEFSYTEEVEDTVYSLGFNMGDIERNPALKHGLEKAARKILSQAGYEF